jgi:outer membrane protein assembly factor BamB
MTHRRLRAMSGAIALAATAFSLAAAEPTGDWPQFRGPGGQGTSASARLPTTWSATENVVWKTLLPGAGTSSAVIKGPRIVLTCYSGFNVPGEPRGEMSDLKLHLVCLSRDDGHIRWIKDVAPQLPEQETIRDNHGYASSTPVVDDERIYVFFGKSGVHAFDWNGEKLWSADVGSRLNGWGSAASPALHKNLLIVNASVESDQLFALDKTTGQEVWKATGIKESWNTPLLVPVEGGRTELVVAIFRKVLGFDPESGKPLWSCDTNIDWYMVPSPVAHDGTVFVIGGRSGGSLAIRTGGAGDVTQTHRVWAGRKGSNVSSPVYHDGHLYWMHDALGIAYCADAKTGELAYETRVQGAQQVYASAVLGDGKVYYVSRTGRTFVVVARPQYELLATNELGERSTFNASPSIAGDRLYLRSDRNLYCLGQE